MNPIAEASRFIADAPRERVRVEALAVTVFASAPDEFDVCLQQRDDRWIVSFDGWHEEFAAPEDAFGCFRFGLSDACALTIEYRGNFPMRWTVSNRKDDEATKETVGLFLYPFWRKRSVREKRNSFAVWDPPSQQ
jgi:hypothetical protein